MNPIRVFPINLPLFFCTLFTLCFISTTGASEVLQTVELPEAKQTSLGLYVTAAEANDKWLASPDEVKILDVRTLEEYIYVGHAPMIWKATRSMTQVALLKGSEW